MRDWNVVVTVNGKAGFGWACDILQEYARIARTEYYNVLVMRVDDPSDFLTWFDAQAAASPTVGTYISHVVPAQETFNFSSAQEFEDKARAIALSWAPRLAGRSFHVRVHRRGFKGRLSTPKEERFLDQALLDSLDVMGTPGRLSFDDPELIIGLETVGNRAGMSLWTRDDLQLRPYLGVD